MRGVTQYLFQFFFSDFHSLNVYFNSSLLIFILSFLSSSLRFSLTLYLCQARQLVGSTFLVRNIDRPELEEGEYYSRDLVGMRVILKV